MVEIQLLYFWFNPNSRSDTVVQVVTTEWNIELVFSYSSNYASRGCFSLHDSVAISDEVRRAASFGSTLIQCCVKDVVSRCLNDWTFRIQQAQEVTL